MNINGTKPQDIADFIKYLWSSEVAIEALKFYLNLVKPKLDWGSHEFYASICIVEEGW